jgi:tetratricopeptide (TPR) repeat protein
MTKTLPFLRSAALVLGASLASGAGAAEAATLWSGTLTVAGQRGASCDPAAARPFTVPITIARVADDLVAWGAMQTATLKAATDDPARLDIVIGGSRAGEVRWTVAPDASLEGQWAETADDTTAGCAWTDAHIDARAVEDDADRDATAYARYLLDVQQALLRMRTARSRDVVRAATTEVARFAAAVPAPGFEHRALAQWFVEAGALARVARSPEVAAQLYAAANTIYERIGDQFPEEAATALASEAQVRRGLGRKAAAEDLIQKGIALLRAQDRIATAAGSSLLNAYGAWRLGAGDATSARASFEAAAAADDARGAKREQAMSLNNVAQALQALGEGRTSEQAFEHALRIARALPDAAGASLVEMIRENLASLRHELGLPTRREA